jgi:hypothetical protein
VLAAAVTLLNARAGVPSWGPELLARTHYALGTGVSTLDTLPGLYAQWERWAADVPARLCLRSGFVCFREVASAMGFTVPDEPDPGGEISLSYEEFLDAVERLREVNFPIERDPEAAWPDFAGWRVTYEHAAHVLAAEIDVVLALWSGPRLAGEPAIPPARPPVGHPLRAPDPGGDP